MKLEFFKKIFEKNFEISNLKKKSAQWEPNYSTRTEDRHHAASSRLT